jgi:hypothetical protein
MRIGGKLDGYLLAIGPIGSNDTCSLRGPVGELPFGQIIPTLGVADPPIAQAIGI